MKIAITLAAALAALAPLASAQQQDVMATMNSIAGALGVQCQFCHADGFGRGRARSSQPPPTSDTGEAAVAPAVPPTHMEIARQMMAMTNELNARVQKITGKAPTDATRVSCVTCHRGVTIPGQLSDILTATYTSKGVDATVQQYRDLRKQYYGRQSYDFGDITLVTVASHMINRHPDDSIALLNLNLEFSPESVPSYMQLAAAYQIKYDSDDAIAALEKALVLDPQNGVVKGRLEQAKMYRRRR